MEAPALAVDETHHGFVVDTAGLSGPGVSTRGGGGFGGVEILKLNSYDKNRCISSCIYIVVSTHMNRLLTTMIP